jgi:predicted esterase
MHYVESLIVSGAADARRVVLVGYSQGAIF